PLINAMQTFVSSRYIVIEHVPPRRRRLLAAFGHERLAAQTVQFSKPDGRVGHHRLDEHTAADAPDPHLLALEAKLPRQPHGLATSVLEKLGDGGGHSNSPIYTISIYPWRPCGSVHHCNHGTVW